ncbi:MAG: DNA polymerase III subunit chi [Gammaproteobacteria bacterium]|nr:MAG: DNA polymerase III subunit chi [Gammaproteobacteria bacterium]
MTRIDFYILASDDPRQRLVTACRIAEKAWRQGMRVFLHAPEQAQALDDLLWTFSSGSFVPHGLQDDEDAPEQPVLVGTGGEPGPEHADVLINLSDEIPPFFTRFRRLAEVLHRSPPVLEQGRARFRHYRERGYELHTHNL